LKFELKKTLKKGFKYFNIALQNKIQSGNPLIPSKKLKKLANSLRIALAKAGIPSCFKTCDQKNDQTDIP